MKREVHLFDNGVKVYDDHLISAQRDRYKKRNIHEAEEEDIFIEILQSIPPDGIFVNIGSAIGYYPILAKKLTPGLTVYAIEPLERHRAFFLENIALNELNQSDFIIHEVGISSSEGKAEFIDKGYGSSIKKGHEKKQSKNAIQTIKTKTLDNLCTEIGRIVDLCQMDVQGLELDVLEGGRNALKIGSVKTFLIGTHSQSLHKGCIDLLTENGYVVECDNYNTKEQPDGILMASKGCQRLGVSKNKP